MLDAFSQTLLEHTNMVSTRNQGKTCWCQRMDIQEHIHRVLYMCTDRSEEATKEQSEPTYSWLPDQGTELPVVA